MILSVMLACSPIPRPYTGSQEALEADVLRIAPVGTSRGTTQARLELLGFDCQPGDAVGALFCVREEGDWCAGTPSHTALMIRFDPRLMDVKARHQWKCI